LQSPLKLKVHDYLLAAFFLLIPFNYNDAGGLRYKTNQQGERKEKKGKKEQSQRKNQLLLQK